MTITVSFARPSDAAEISAIAFQTAQIHSEQIPDEFKKASPEAQAQYIKNSIESPESTVFKAETDGQTCGYLVLYINTLPEKFFVHSKQGFAGSIGVDEKFRGRGVATAMLKAAEEFLKKRGVTVFDIDVYTFNERAEKFYDSYGFKDLKHYKRKLLLP